MKDVTRRGALGVVTAAVAATTARAADPAAAPVPATPVPAFAGNHKPAALKFDPTKLNGLS